MSYACCILGPTRSRAQEESLELVFRGLPPGSTGSMGDVIEVIDSVLKERGVEVSAGL